MTSVVNVQTDKANAHTEANMNVLWPTTAICTDKFKIKYIAA